MGKDYDVITVISKCLYFKNVFILRVVSFADTSEFTTFIKTQKTLKELENMYQTAIYICIS